MTVIYINCQEKFNQELCVKEKVDYTPLICFLSYDSNTDSFFRAAVDMDIDVNAQIEDILLKQRIANDNFNNLKEKLADQRDLSARLKNLVFEFADMNNITLESKNKMIGNQKELEALI